MSMMGRFGSLSGPAGSEGVLAGTRTLRDEVGPEAYRAIYENSPDGVLLTAPMVALRAGGLRLHVRLVRTEAEIRARGRQGLADGTDERWGPLLAERERSGQARGIARMVRGDGALIEVEMSARTFDDDAGESRSCTIFRDVTERVRTEHELSAISAQLRALTVTTSSRVAQSARIPRRRRPIARAGRPRRRADAALMFLDLDNLKELNDRYGHSVGDAALRAVARALGEVLGVRTGVAHRRRRVRRAGAGPRRTRAPCARGAHPRTPRRVAHGHGGGRRIEVSIGWARARRRGPPRSRS